MPGNAKGGQRDVASAGRVEAAPADEPAGIPRAAARDEWLGPGRFNHVRAERADAFERIRRTLKDQGLLDDAPASPPAPLPPTHPLSPGVSIWHPDPTDPYERDPKRWDVPPQAPAPERDPPDAYRGALADPLDPKPYLDQFGNKWDSAGEMSWENIPEEGAYAFKQGLDLLPAQKQQAARARDAFRPQYETWQVSCMSAFPAIKDYNLASQELTGDLGALLGWSGDPAKAADLAALTRQQRVGPGGAATVGELFDQGADGKLATETNVDAKNAAHGNAHELNELRATAATREVELQKAGFDYKAAIEESAHADRALALAIGRAKIVELKGESRELAAEKTRAEQEREQRREEVELYLSVIDNVLRGMVLPFLSGTVDAELGKTGNKMFDATEKGIFQVVKSLCTEELDQRIRALNAQIHQIQVTIDSTEVRIAQDEIEDAKIVQQIKAEAVPLARRAITTAMKNAQDAYKAFAKAAGDAVSLGDAQHRGDPIKGARVQAAIQAIPRVGLLVGRLRFIRSQIRLPQWSEDAGRGYHAYNRGEILDSVFLPGLARLKFYAAKFEREEAEWSRRLVSLQGVMDQFSTAPK